MPAVLPANIGETVSCLEPICLLDTESHQRYPSRITDFGPPLEAIQLTLTEWESKWIWHPSSKLARTYWFSDSIARSRRDIGKLNTGRMTTAPYSKCGLAASSTSKKYTEPSIDLPPGLLSIGVIRTRPGHPFIRRPKTRKGAEEKKQKSTCTRHLDRSDGLSVVLQNTSL